MPEKLFSNELIATLIFFALGFIWHGSFFLVALFAAGVSIASTQISNVRKRSQSIKNLQQRDSMKMGLEREKGAR